MPAKSYVEQNRTGRVGRIPSPTPFPVGDINAYLLLPSSERDTVTLIDTGVRSPEAWEALHRGLKEYGVGIERIDRILVTHAHPDHFGQAARIVEASGALVFAGAIEAERMESGWSPRVMFGESARELFLSFGVPEEKLMPTGRAADPAQRVLDPIAVDVVVEEGDRLDVGDFHLEVVATPGHTEGHIVFYEPELRWLFSGDHLLTDISPVPLLHVPTRGERREPSLLRFIHSLAKCEALDCEATFPSHGEVIWSHHELIESYRLHHDRRALQIERRLRDGPLSPFEIGKRMFKRFMENELFLVLSEVVGHLELLEQRGAVVLEEEGGVLRARSTGTAGDRRVHR